MNADQFLRDRLHAAVDAEPIDVELNFRRFTAPDLVDRQPTLGPRRRWAVAAGALVAAAAAIGLAVWAITSDRLEPKPVHTPNPGPTATARPGDVPTVGRLVFVAPFGNGADAIDRMGPNDERPSVVRSEEGIVAVAGSPDGRFIAYTTQQARGEDAIQVVAIGGGQPRMVAQTTAASGISWSPADPILAFTSNDGLYEVQAEGRGLHELADPPERCAFYQSAWSPDGTQIAVSVGCAPGSEISAGIFVSSATKWEPREVVSAYDVAGGASWSGISWSPDGTQIAFSAVNEGASHVWVVDAAGGTPRNLTPGFGRASFPAWSPDGAWIGFIDDGGVSLMRADGSDKQAVPGARGLAAKSLTWMASPHQEPPRVLPPPSGPFVQAVVRLQTWVGAMAESGGFVWAIGGRELARIDPATNRLDYTFRLPEAPEGSVDVASDGAGGVWFVYGDAVWHMNKPGDRPSVHDLHGARELVLGGGRVWVFTGDTFVSFDPVTGRSLGTVSIERCTCSSIAYFDGSLWAGDRNPVGGLDRFDPDTGQVVARIQAGSPAALVVANGRLWDLGDPGVYLIDAQRNSARRTDRIPEFEGYSSVSATAGDGLIWANGGNSGMSNGGSVVEIVSPVSGRVVGRLDPFRIDSGGCQVAVAANSLWETCTGYRSDDRGRAIAVLPTSYVVRIGEPARYPIHFRGSVGGGG